MPEKTPTASAAPIRVATVKLEATVPASALVSLALDDNASPWAVSAVLFGNSVRQMLRTVAEHPPEGTQLVLSGNLRPPATPGGPFRLENVGLTCVVKTPNPPPKG